MIEFHWQGVSSLGIAQKGIILAPNKAQAQLRLANAGVFDVKLQRNWRLPRKLTSADVLHFCQQLAMLSQAKVPISQAIELIQHNTRHKALFAWLETILQKLALGYHLSQALAEHRHVFSAQERELISIGEQTGTLPEILTRIARAKSEQMALRQKLQKMAFYPTLVFVISFVLALLLLLFVVPVFGEMYQQNHQTLPHFTVWLLDLSRLAQTYGMMAVGVLILGVVGIKWQIRKNDTVRAWFTRLWLKLPVVGAIMQAQARLQLSQNLSLMLNAGLTLVQAVDILAKQKSNVVQHHALVHCQQLLAQGYRFSQSVGSTLFSQQEQSMLHIAEQSNALGVMLAQMSDAHRRALNHKLDLLSQLLEPMLMLLIGAMIGGVMLGLYLPIFNMGAMLG
ncbi:type II secretion system F family protein [Pasteurellaceae bacterium HPA106]|uniref:type II secretion system F family protein n=1 Tax=Spirabiliibacterium pneumoniae TaxID=221400 RepID=UPI001AAD4EB2|nr:type II secretion system F family protein [Spirabiliibacterium pneumoniae]MBE2896772.1 type II secretion system F family protein [Spirabiliibacterium pneumoniae]